MKYELTVGIEAAPDRVWEVMVDVERWPEWTPSVSVVELLDPGPLHEGARVRLVQPRLPATVWTVTHMDWGRSFTWRASSPGLSILGQHSLAVGRGVTQVTLAIRQTGWLAGLTGLLTSSLTRTYVGQEAAGLKLRCERGSLP